MKTEESSSSLPSTKVLSPSSFIRSVRKEEKELEGDDDSKDDDDEEDHQWIGFFENITNTINLDDKDEGNDDNDDDRNEGATAGKSSSSITIKTEEEEEEEEVPDSISSKSSVIEIEEEEVYEELYISIINNTFVWGDGTITGVTACEGQQQVKKEGKKKEHEEAAAEKEDDNGNEKGYESLAEGISPNTNDAFTTGASTNHCGRRKYNSNNNKDYDNADDERKPPHKKKIRILAAVEVNINGDGNGDGTSSKTIQTESKYTNKQIESWNKMFRRFVAYNGKHQTTNVPIWYKEDPQLRAWISKQRTCRKNNKISKYRMDLLDGIGFVWEINDTQWMEMYQRLITYKKRHTNTSVPQHYKDDPKLATWVDTQRQYYRKKELSVERINYLESIGFVWKIRDFLPWIKMYERLVAYKHCHQSTLVPRRYTVDPSLGHWVSNQRT